MRNYALVQVFILCMLWRETRRNVILNIDLECMVTFYKGILNKTYLYILINSLVWRELCSFSGNEVSICTRPSQDMPSIIIFFNWMAFLVSRECSNSSCKCFGYMHLSAMTNSSQSKSHLEVTFANNMLALPAWRKWDLLCQLRDIWGCQQCITIQLFFFPIRQHK